MKALISGIAILILLIQFNFFQLDFDSYIRAMETLKFQAEDCSVAGALCTEDDSFGIGQILYDIQQSEDKIRELLIKNMDLNSTMCSNDTSYWMGKVDYTVWYYDDDFECVKTQNGKEVERYLFSYGDVFHDDVTGYEYLIVNPTVIVRLEVDGIHHRTEWIKWNRITRVASYEYFK